MECDTAEAFKRPILILKILLVLGFMYYMRNSISSVQAKPEFSCSFCLVGCSGKKRGRAGLSGGAVWVRLLPLMPTEGAPWGHLTTELLVPWCSWAGQWQDTDSKASLLNGTAANIPHKCVPGKLRNLASVWYFMSLQNFRLYFRFMMTNTWRSSIL